MIVVAIAIVIGCLYVSFWIGFRVGAAGASFVGRLDDQERLWQREDWNQKLERRRKLRARFEGRDGAA